MDSCFVHAKTRQNFMAKLIQRPTRKVAAKGYALAIDCAHAYSTDLQVTVFYCLQKTPSSLKHSCTTIVKKRNGGCFALNFISFKWRSLSFQTARLFMRHAQ